MGKHEHWPFDDPAKFQGNDLERLAFARKIRDEIDSRIRQWLTDQNIQPV
jgi:arsenate reductase